MLNICFHSLNYLKKKAWKLVQVYNLILELSPKTPLIWYQIAREGQFRNKNNVQHETKLLSKFHSHSFSGSGGSG